MDFDASFLAQLKTLPFTFEVNERPEEMNRRPPEMPWPEVCDQSAKGLSSSPERAYMRTATFPMPAAPLPR